MLTQIELKEVLNYSPETGVFTWAARLANCIKIGDVVSSTDTCGYIRAQIKGSRYSVHRLAWLYMYGVWPKEVDHINQNRTDNRISNLRDTTHSGNMKNLPKNKRNKSGVTGVYWDKASQKWAACVNVNSRNITLGRFNSKDEASKARQNANIKYEFHPNHGKRRKANHGK